MSLKEIIEFSAETPYKDLDSFRQQWNELKKDPDFNAKRLNQKIWWDRCLFFGFSLFFLLLGTIIFFKTPNWTCNVFFNDCYTVKTMICVFCLVLSSIAFWTGYKICPKKHAVNDLVGKAKKNLSRLYSYRQSELTFSADKKQLAIYYKQAYHYAKDKIQEGKEEAFRLIDNISRWPALDNSSREHLLNQTILELNDKLNKIIVTFKATSQTQIKKS